MTKRLTTVGLALIVLLAQAPALLKADVTDEDVRRAIEKGKEYLISRQGADGAFAGERGMSGDYTCFVYMTLAYMGMHPNRPVMDKGLQAILALSADAGLSRPGYSLPMRTMALAYVHNKLLGDRRTAVRQAMMQDVLRYQIGQTGNGAWRYQLDASSWDNSVTQWPILAMSEAYKVGIEIPLDPVRKAMQHYFETQHADGGWHYQTRDQSYGSMSAAGTASLFIIRDLLDPGSGCPCVNQRSRRNTTELDRRIDTAVKWMSDHFEPTSNPNANGTPGRGRTVYWLYTAERVGVHSGYKYFGDHDWYKEGVEYLLKKQQGDGSFGSLKDTCFSLIYLYKGRAPILFNKLKFDGLWNMHRRDAANLTEYIKRTKEQLFHWQIVEMKPQMGMEKAVEELHDAPILYISAESEIPFTNEEKKLLRLFTDTGGTVLFEPSCGNVAIRKWFMDFAKEIWPEWRLEPLGTDHGVYTDPYPLTKRPELMGLNDGMRTFLMMSLDDISCPWHTKAYASRQYLFNWGINMVKYSTDGAPLRAKLQPRVVREKEERYKDPVSAGGKTSLRLARVRHPGNWEVGANYKTLPALAKLVQERAGVTLDVATPAQVPVTEGGVEIAALGGHDVAYFAGSDEFTLTDAQGQALKSYVEGGGFVWFEAALGSVEFYNSVRDLAKDLGWTFELMPTTDGLLTGRMNGAIGYNLASGVKFRRSLRVKRLGRLYAEFIALRDASGKLVALFSPLDTLYGLTPYEAYGCAGYLPPDAKAVATNIVLYLTTRGS